MPVSATFPERPKGKETISREVMEKLVTPYVLMYEQTNIQNNILTAILNIISLKLNPNNI
jgi:hypothetical protein